eukprot:1472799-Pyramimonas_sp.AAC.1
MLHTCTAVGFAFGPTTCLLNMLTCITNQQTRTLQRRFDLDSLTPSSDRRSPTATARTPLLCGSRRQPDHRPRRAYGTQPCPCLGPQSQDRVGLFFTVIAPPSPRACIRPKCTCRFCGDSVTWSHRRHVLVWKVHARGEGGANTAKDEPPSPDSHGPSWFWSFTLAPKSQDRVGSGSSRFALVTNSGQGWFRFLTLTSASRSRSVGVARRCLWPCPGAPAVGDQGSACAPPPVGSYGRSSASGEHSATVSKSE